MSPFTQRVSANRRSVRFPAILLLLGALGGLGGCTNDPSDKDIKEISLNEVRALREGKDASRTMLVDPRAPGDFEAGHIPGAQNHQINSERSRTGDGLNPVFRGYKHLIVYGNDPTPGPAMAMSKRLVIMGADGVRLFKGGLVEWKRAGLPVEKTEPAVADEGKTSGTLAK